MNIGTREARALALLSGNGLFLARFLDGVFLPTQRIDGSVFASPGVAGLLTLALSIPALIGVVTAYVMLIAASRRVLSWASESLSILCFLGLSIALMSGAGTFLQLEERQRLMRQELEMSQPVRPGDQVTCMLGDCTIQGERDAAQ